MLRYYSGIGVRAQRYSLASIAALSTRARRSSACPTPCRPAPSAGATTLRAGQRNAHGRWSFKECAEAKRKISALHKLNEIENIC
jgi:hypothetical protein